MQIGFRSAPTLPAPVYRRDELDERRQQQREQVNQQSSQQQAAGEVTRIRTRASVAAQRSESQTQYTDNLPPRGRNAVAAYNSNGPSIEERLGIELVGVDLYV